jgi:cytoskeleton protein RodZ
MTSVGDTLRQERMRRNVDLQQVSEELKISSRMLEAIEADEYGKLPGGVFAKSFVRQYASLLGLDGDEIAAQFERAVQSPELARLTELRQPHAGISLPRMDEPRFSAGRQRSVLPSLIAVVVVMLICSGIYAWWQRNRQLAAARPEPSPPSDTRRAAAPKPAGKAQPAAPQPQQQPAETAAAAAPPAPQTPAPQTESQPGVPQPLVPDAGAAGTGAVQVELVVAEPVWVSVRRDGRSIYQGELKPNEIRTVAANTEVTLKLGNAGGLTILLNGKPIPSPGPKGQVRTVQLTSGGFQIVAPAAPAGPRAPALLDPL